LADALRVDGSYVRRILNLACLALLACVTLAIGLGILEPAASRTKREYSHQLILLFYLDQDSRLDRTQNLVFARALLTQRRQNRIECLRPRLDFLRLDHQRRRKIHQASHNERALTQLQTLAAEISFRGTSLSRYDAQVEISAGLVAREDRGVTGVERDPDSLGEMLIKMLDGSDVL